jgi:starvation-inducible DNA-binding protein
MKNYSLALVLICTSCLIAYLPFSAAAQAKLDYRNEKADERIPLEKDKQAAVATELQAMLVELIELHHQAKQCHWNIKGPLYLPIHELLEDYGKIHLEYADLVAERLLQIGMNADGRTEMVARTANIGTIPPGALTDKQVLDLMSEHIYTVAIRTRQRITKLGKLDEVSSNLLQDLSYKLDKQVWQLRVMQQ